MNNSSLKDENVQDSFNTTSEEAVVIAKSRPTRDVKCSALVASHRLGRESQEGHDRPIPVRPDDPTNPFESSEKIRILRDRQ
jgi:hypothetical protein